MQADDRRDVLVIRELIGSSWPDTAPSANAVRALAFSAHAAARMQPSVADDTARLSLDAWLQERNLSLEASAEEEMSLTELDALGWIPAPPRALIAPLGTLIVEPPKDGVWSISSASLLPRPRPVLATIVFHTAVVLYSFAAGIFEVVTNVRPSGLDTALSIGLLLQTTKMFWLAFIPVVCGFDLANACAGRAPLPLAVFRSVRANFIAVMPILLAGGTLVYYSAYVWLIPDLADGVQKDLSAAQSVRPGDASRTDAQQGLAITQKVLNSVSNGGLAVFLVYEAFVYAAFAISQSRYFSGGGRPMQVRIDTMHAPTGLSKSVGAAPGRLPRRVRHLLHTASERALRTLSLKLRHAVTDRASSQVGEEVTQLELTDLSAAAGPIDVGDEPYLPGSLERKTLILPDASASAV